ncbi:hypothetical protein AHF37_04493 [Paragonimus kellicotti]|nr:hypothetical protein AHF37_04493 [Paragonimus kellicotti]
MALVSVDPRYKPDENDLKQMIASLTFYGSAIRCVRHLVHRLCCEEKKHLSSGDEISDEMEEKLKTAHDRPQVILFLRCLHTCLDSIIDLYADLIPWLIRGVPVCQLISFTLSVRSTG